MNKYFWLVTTLLSALVGCSSGNNDDNPGKVYDPTYLADSYEREVLKDCNGTIVSDQIRRYAAVNSYKMNPKQNIFIASASFFNLENGQEFTPSGVIFPGDGGDNLKWVSFCQEPRVSGCGLAVKPGDNRIEYKYWTHEHPNTLGEDRTIVIHFKTSNTTSKRTCTRVPKVCPAPSTGPTYSDCHY